MDDEPSVELIEPRRGEHIAHYLARCMNTADSLRRPVRACLEGVSIIVRPSMSTDELADQWVEAKARSRRKGA